MQTIQFEIDGMSCHHCVERVKRALDTLDGARSEEVAIGSARVQFDPGRLSPEQIADTIRGAGYDARPAGSRAA